jgi:hypothetical protein
MARQMVQHAVSLPEAAAPDSRTAISDDLRHAAELARMLVRHLGVEGAAKTCRENHWDGVLAEVMGQASVSTTS